LQAFGVGYAAAGEIEQAPVSSEVDLQLAKVATQGVAKATLFV
jgi:hypothetical protein